MQTAFTPCREPLRNTLLRTVTIAAVVGAVFALRSGWVRWPLATLLSLWPAFGGHWIEVFFLNVLRQRLPASRAVQIAARLAVWFAGGVVLALCVGLTAKFLTGLPFERWPAWWLGGAAFIAIELIAHLVMQLRGLPSFYNRRG